MLRFLVGCGVAVALVACGARSTLKDLEGRGGSGGAGAGGDGGAGGDAGAGLGGEAGGGRGGIGGGEAGMGGSGGTPPPILPCMGMTEQPCGSSVGECVPGTQFCQPDGFFGPCIGRIGPVEETCNGRDDDCDGEDDNGFNIGAACDGPDSDFCADDVMTCDGCSLGPDLLEVCNGVDDNCNGEIDSDCEIGGCSPTLLVTGSVPSSPNCVDFPVEAGSTGVINYPCQGGSVSATLGAISFTGSVTDGNVSLAGSDTFIGPDGCLWRADHSITGSIPGGTVTYFYQEILLTMPQGNCWFPCTETGTVDIDWQP